MPKPRSNLKHNHYSKLVPLADTPEELTPKTDNAPLKAAPAKDFTQ